MQHSDESAGDHRRRRYSSPVGWDEISFITLAKAGGRRDLLQHHSHEAAGEEAQPYPRVDWFDHLTPEPPATPPLGAQHADLALMQWEDGGREEGGGDVALPAIEGRRGGSRLQQPASETTAVKLPTILVEGVDFSRLLSMDYQREWLEQRAQQRAKQRRRQRARHEAQRRKLAEHTSKARKIAGVGVAPTPKPRFIMKKFANVPSKLSLPKLEHTQQQ